MRGSAVFEISTPFCLLIVVVNNAVVRERSLKKSRP